MPRDEREMERARKRLLDQIAGTAKRSYSDGRLGAEDEGDLALAISADKRTNSIIVNFGKPVKWLAFSPKQAVHLAETLIKHARSISTEPLTVEL